MAFYKILTVKVNNIYNTPNVLYTIPSKLQYQYDMIFLMSGHHYIRLQAKPIWKHRTKLLRDVANNYHGFNTKKNG